MSERYRVELAKRASKDLTRLRNLEETITRELLSLEEDPYKGHLLTGSLRGARALEISLGGVAYRAAYVVLEDKSVCLVFMVGPHEGFYAKAERRARILRQSGAPRDSSEF
jgi:addiction module RelE/StbE family toxin